MVNWCCNVLFAGKTTLYEFRNISSDGNTVYEDINLINLYYGN